MSDGRPNLLFVSPIFLLPADAGGKIRTTNILKGMKGGAFRITLASPDGGVDVSRFNHEIDQLCDHFVAWPHRHKARWQRVFDLAGDLPINVALDRTVAGRAAVGDLVATGKFDLVVYDFLHSTVLMPDDPHPPAVCFTHNVEAEIFGRHAEKASSGAMRAIWRSQHRKMIRFEAAALRKFAGIVAVSERDAAHFRDALGLGGVHVIPTGVDLEYFGPPKHAFDESKDGVVVFTGSMDSAANIDGIAHFLTEIWPLVIARSPRARFDVVGRNPPSSLTGLARQYPSVRFTGSVDDVRPYVHGAQVFVIPLRVGGGTRIKAFEAMAMGCPVVSTSLGIEGLPVQEGVHYLGRDNPESFAEGVCRLLEDRSEAGRLVRHARELVVGKFGHTAASKSFEAACLTTLATRRS